jgi:hypothetical protein
LQESGEAKLQGIPSRKENPGMTPVLAVRNSFFSRYSMGALCWARKRCRRFLGNFAALSLLALAITVTVSGQTLVVTSSGSTISQGATLTSTTIPSMPNLVLSVNGGSSCDRVSYIVDVSYTDQAGSTTWAQYSAQNSVGDQPVTVSWSGILTGGSATVSWQFNGVNQSSTLGFFITGTNPPNSIVDTYALSGPWFVRNLIAWESRAWNLAPLGQYKQFDSLGYPLFGAPDGIGLMQLEPPNRISLDQDYWSWPANVADGLATLNGKQASAYSFWNTHLGRWQADAAGPSHPVPESLFAFCDFKYPATGGDSYADSEWMKAYNGAVTYFIYWIKSTVGSNPPNGHWVIDDSPNNYVHQVCKSASL